MTKSEFEFYKHSLKVHGNHFGILWINSEKHKIMMLEYIKEINKIDKLAERQYFQKSESPKISFLFTT